MKQKLPLIIAVVLLLIVGAFCGFLIYDAYETEEIPTGETVDIPSQIKSNEDTAFAFLNKSENILPDDMHGYIVDPSADMSLEDTSEDALKKTAQDRGVSKRDIYSEYKINYMKEGLDLSDIEDKSLYINEVLKEVSAEEDEIKQEFILRKLEKEFDIHIDILKNNLKKQEKCSRIKALNTNEAQNKKKNKYEKATYNILYTIMNNYEACKYYEKHLNFLPTKEARYLANEIIYTYKIEGKLVMADFITKLNDKEELMDFVKDVLNNVSVGESNLEAFKDYIVVIKEYNKNQEIKRLKELIEKEFDMTKKSELLEKIRLVKMGSEN